MACTKAGRVAVERARTGSGVRRKTVISKRQRIWVCKPRNLPLPIPRNDPDPPIRRGQEMSQALKRIRELEMENEVLRKGGSLPIPAAYSLPKIMGPLAQRTSRQNRPEHVPVAVTCRVLGFNPVVLQMAENPCFRPGNRRAGVDRQAA
jgi:hypothetical protein